MNMLGTAGASDYDISLNQDAALDDLMAGEFTAYANCYGSFGSAGTFGTGTGCLGTFGTAGTFGCGGGGGGCRDCDLDLV